jgi:molybdopterin-guanine dinucleotide biosynthesis protein B
MAGIVAFVGHHNSGKTTFATQVVRELVRRGYRVGVIKSTKEKGVVKDTPGKDSFRYREAGAGAVAVAGGGELFLFKGTEGKVEPEYLAFLEFGDFDIVICEGFKGFKVPKIEVFRSSLKEEPLYRKLEGVVGVVSDEELPGVRWFPIDSPQLVADFLEREFIKGEEVELFVNGRKVPLKKFVQESLKGTLLGFISALKGIDGSLKKVELRVNVDKEKPI